MHETGGAVVDRRLEPAGLTRMLGPCGEGRGRVLGFGLLLLAGAGAILVALPPPPASIGMVFIVPVVLLSAEFGVRAGLLCAAASTGMLLVWAVTTAGSGQDLIGILVRSLALLFLAWIVGRLSERAARSRRLLEQVIESTSDSIYLKDLEGRYLLVNSAAAQLIGRPGSEILGLTNAALLPGVTSRSRWRGAEPPHPGPGCDRSAALRARASPPRRPRPAAGLFNRRRFEQELERQASEVARYGPRGALLVLDLDHFKYVNDALGHHAGDELILSVAALPQSRLRGSDIVARLGGDEFAVLLPTASPDEAEHVAGELLRAVREDAGLDGASRRAA